jgi:hypothetical protein
MTAIYEHGTFPDTDTPVNEPNLLVNSVGYKPSRTKKTWMDADTKADARIRYSNPVMTISIDSFVSVLAGLAIQEPGTAVASLLNFADTIHGFDPSDGVMVYEDPERSDEIEEMIKLKFDVVHHPFVE